MNGRCRQGTKGKSKQWGVRVGGRGGGREVRKGWVGGGGWSGGGGGGGGALRKGPSVPVTAEPE